MTVGDVVGAVLSPALTETELTNLEERRLDAMEVDPGRYGLLVGIGSRMGSGCTSGHGVCGISRLSPRSLAATASFMLAGFTVFTFARFLVGI